MCRTSNKDRQPRHTQRGATLLEALIALGLMGIMMAMGARQLNGYQQQLKDQVASQHLKQVTDAAADYLRANAATVAATATPTTPAVISVADLIAGNFLPPSFRAQNPYNQTARVEVLEPTANELQALVLYTGGDTLTGVQAPAIAVRAGAAGGYVPSDNPTVAQGAYGGWQVSLSGYTNPGPNKLAAFLYFDNGNLANDYLYRHAVPGKPELNKMFTALDMGGNTITNAGQVRINGNNAGAGWSDTDLVIGDSSVNRHDSSLSIMSITSAIKMQAVGDTLNLRQWGGSDISTFDTGTVRTRKLHVNRGATFSYPMTVLSVNNEWYGQERSLISLGADSTSDMYTRIHTWSRTASGVDTAATGNYLQVGENGNTYTPGNLMAGGDVWVGARGQWLSALLPRYVAKEGYIVADNTTVAKPACPGGGVPKIILTPQKQQLWDSENENTGDVNYATYATDNGSSWQVYVQSASWSSGVAGGTVLAMTYCYY